MKQTFGFLLLLCLTLMACAKDPELVDNDITIGPTDTVLRKGNFVSGAHSTSGTATIIETEDGQRYLILENFDTDGGPDLRIYLATDKSADTYTELTDKVQTGNVKLAIPANTDVASKNFVLVWCKQFSVLFGHAETKP